MRFVDRRWLMLGVIFLARISTGFQFQSVGSVAPFLVSDFRLSYAEIGWLIGLFSLPGAIIALPGGMLGQRFGARHIAWTALGLMTVGAVVTAIAPTFFAAAVGRVTSGIGVILLGVAIPKMIADWFTGKELATAMAVMLTAWPTGIALALVSVGLIATLASWRLGMHVAAMLALLGLVLLLTFYRDPPAAAETSGPSVAPTRLSRHEFGLAVSGGLAWCLFNAALLTFVSFAPSALIANGASVAVAGFLVSLALWATVFSVPLGGYLADRVGHVDVIMGLGSLATAVFMAAVAVVPAPGLWAFLTGVALGAPPGAIMALLPKAIAPAKLATAFGVFYSVYYLGVAIVQPLAGLLRDRSGIPSAPVLFAAVVMALTPVCLAIFRRVERARMAR